MANTYTTVLGDTWDVIAKKVYNDELKAGVLMESNPALLDTFVFYSGVVITVPELTEEEIKILPPWRT